MATNTKAEAKAKSFGENLESDLALEFLRVVENAAIASAHTMGQGDRKLADQVATEAMRETMETVPMRGTIVIGEGERDEAPMLYIGEHGADLLADVEHGRLVALAFADDDGAAHGNCLHGFAHGLGRDLVGEFAVALSHGVGGSDGGVLYHPQELQCQIALQILTEALCSGFGLGIGCHHCLLKK